MSTNIDLYCIDGKWVEIKPTKFTLKYLDKSITKEDHDAIVLTYNNGEFELFGAVSNFESILRELLNQIQKGVA